MAHNGPEYGTGGGGDWECSVAGVDVLNILARTPPFPEALPLEVVELAGGMVAVMVVTTEVERAGGPDGIGSCAV